VSPEADLRSRPSIHKQKRDTEKTSGQAVQFNIWSIWTMGRTSAQPQLNLSLLRSNILWNSSLQRLYKVNLWIEGKVLLIKLSYWHSVCYHIGIYRSDVSEEYRPFCSKCNRVSTSNRMNATHFASVGLCKKVRLLPWVFGYKIAWLLCVETLPVWNTQSETEWQYSSWF